MTKRTIQKVLYVSLLSLVLTLPSVSCSINIGISSVTSSQDTESEVPTELVTVSISETTLSLNVGQHFKLEASASDNSKISWISSNDDKVYVSSDGTIFAREKGEVTIIASCGKAMKKCEVVVNEGTNNDVTLLDSNFAMNVDTSLFLVSESTSNQKVKFLNENEDVLDIFDDGRIDAKKEGEATLIAYTDNGFTFSTIIVSSTPLEEQFGKGRLIWNDEFEEDKLDTTKWGYNLGVQDTYGESTGPKYWGNEELQYYTKDAATVSDGLLKITAKKQDMAEGRTYSSARLLTRNKASFTYGYIEARMKTPALEGMWPAFWMLPEPESISRSGNAYGGWPNSGEIDIYEAKGRLKNKVDTTLHFSKTEGGHIYKGKTYTMSSNTDNWHTYAVDWKEDHITWLVDGIDVFTLKNTDWSTAAAPANNSAPFDKPFYILLNLAVGGNYDGGVKPTDDFVEASMYVDYVRVYE